MLKFIFYMITLFTIYNQPAFLIATPQFKHYEGDLHFDRLGFLKSKGFDPKVVYDIGAFKGYWSKSISEVFPNGKFFLFEANSAHKLSLASQPFPFYIAVLGDSNKLVSFFSNDSTGDSVFQEQTRFYVNGNQTEQKLQMTTLKDLVQKEKIPLPDLIKIDVQGAEKLIVEGSPEIISHAEVVILETKILEYNKNAPFIIEMMSLMNSLGYRMMDILELHYLPSGELNEIDVLYIKKNSPLIKTGILM
ncbi:MAG: FkbM family methyltransferase [Chlamydiales bacterium]